MKRTMLQRKPKRFKSLLLKPNWKLRKHLSNRQVPLLSPNHQSQISYSKFRKRHCVFALVFTHTGIPSLFPYCLKVETWLKLAGIKYKNLDHKMKYHLKKGQLPFTELNGDEIADSSIIIKD